ncbi:AAA family ATPase [Pseudomonas quasicaspiana]|uniref:AAA family ATPase n=1 Tax=Pseudomonas quasicaspiana TaxID=2829821 RepID=UPI001E5665E4|nr:AAA family ATPase [Pseudomonas quasicaspiana]MCD5973281.1 AAA family ATPase [Pseudomonas quasicaspiana]
MKLVRATVGPFRSINEPQAVSIDPEVTVLVGMNEAGKTVFLKALHKARDALGKEVFNITDDYPRKDVTKYRRRHEEEPDVAVKLTYRLVAREIERVNKLVGTDLTDGFEFSMTFDYQNQRVNSVNVTDGPVLKKMSTNTALSEGVRAILKDATTIRSASKTLAGFESPNDADTTLIESLTKRIAAADGSKGWDNISAYEVLINLTPSIPSFLYFSDYDLLPGKLNLHDLKQRVNAAAADPANASKQIEPKHQAVLALLRMAEVDLTDFDNGKSYEELKSQIEAVSISLTDQVLEFWKQNEDLEVEIDIRTDTSEASPFNNGPNIYLRIRNRRHRGVSTPFDQRSRGFIWFFSFLVWFDSVQHQLDASGKASTKSLVLLLDEPALALHALAQTDFLSYIDYLSENYQVIYTTHSPFMVHSDRLHQARVVEDKVKIGTVVSDNLSGSDPRTIFPLQAALGWNLAQNLFVTKFNLLVEGISELSILQAMSHVVEAAGGAGLMSNATIVPAGGLSNVATFVSLLGANGLNLAVLHDYNGKPEQKLESLVHQKLLKKKSVFNFSQFRDLSKIGEDSIATDVEDLLDPDSYMAVFSSVFQKDLGHKVITQADLPTGDRIIGRIEKYLTINSIKIRPSGGYNHYAVAAAFVANITKYSTDDTVTRFTALFKDINAALK